MDGGKQIVGGVLWLASALLYVYIPVSIESLEWGEFRRKFKILLTSWILLEFENSRGREIFFKKSLMEKVELLLLERWSRNVAIINSE